MFQIIYKLSLFTFISILLTSCGSIKTLGKSDPAVQREAKRMLTKCDAITRAYSGVVFDFCALHSKPKTFKESGVTIEGEIVIISIFLDMILSGVLDTLALPYTAPQQIKFGSIIIEHNYQPNSPLAPPTSRSTK